MFLRLLTESFVRQRRRKALAGVAILLGTTAVTAMLALATTIGDRIHQELAVYGANIVVTPKADSLAVKVGGIDLKPATGGAYLKESDLEKLHGIFWANNITAVSAELRIEIELVPSELTVFKVPDRWTKRVSALGMRFPRQNADHSAGKLPLHPSWRLTGQWPTLPGLANYEATDVVLGSRLAVDLRAKVGSTLYTSAKSLPDPDGGGRFNHALRVTGVVSTGDADDDKMMLPIRTAQDIGHVPNAVSRIEISARTRPEDAFARLDPDKLSPKQHDIWYCRPYANSIAYQIREAIPGSDAQQIRKVEQTEGTVLERISGLMWLISAAALLAAGFAVSAAMATAVLERRGEIGLMRSLGAGRAAIATLFYAESGLLAIAAGTVGYLAGSLLAWWLGGHIFAADAAAPVLNLVLLPIVVAMALIVAVAGSTPSIRAALRTDPASTLRGDA